MLHPAAHRGGSEEEEEEEDKRGVELGFRAWQGKRSCVVDLKQKQKRLEEMAFKIAAQKPQGMV